MKDSNFLNIVSAIFKAYLFVSPLCWAGSHTNNSGDFVRSVILTNYGPEVIRIVSRNPTSIKTLKELNLSLSDLEATLRSDLWVLIEKGQIGDGVKYRADVEGSSADALYIEGKIHLVEDSWTKRINFDLGSSNPELRRNTLLLTAHEMLRLAKIDDTDYVVSKTFFDNSTPASLNAIVLEEYAVAEKGGLSESDARKWCNERFRKYSERYFDVVCEIHKNSWSETHSAIGFYTQSRIAGTASYSHQSLSSRQALAVAEAETRTFHGSAKAYAGSINGSSTSYSYPVLLNESVPFQYSYSVSKSLFGIRILGIGDLESLPWKVLERSYVEGRSFGNLSFESAEIAARECVLAILAARQNRNSSFRYFRAKCAVPKQESDGSFSFTIQSKNPFVSSQSLDF